MTNRKKKVAVLGGGMSAMSSVYELLKSDNFEGNYDITVYQMGWRIGGKCASGRKHHYPGADDSVPWKDQILEHGLHAWFGWYTNAFNQFKDLYSHKPFPNDYPFATWQEAFTTEDYVAIMEQAGGVWAPWDIRVPTLPEDPGGYEELPTVQQIIDLLFDKLTDYLTHSDFATNHGHTVHEHEGLLKRMEAFFVQVEEYPIKKTLEELLHAMGKALEREKAVVVTAGHPIQGGFFELLDELWNWIYEKIGKEMARDLELKKFFIIFDLGMAFLRGLIADNLVEHGLNSINDMDFKEWLTSHGAIDVSVNSVMVRTVYDSCFAYYKGDPRCPNLEAGTALRLCLCIALGSKRHWLWKMNAGMGDTIMSPYYTFFKKHNVKFEFFHKVMDMQLTDDKNNVAEIIMERQVTLKDEYKEHGYNPIFKVKGLDCWPSEPFYDQLVEGEELIKLKNKGLNVNLESLWSVWPGCRNPDERKISLKRCDEHGNGDFDIVLLAIPISSHFNMCSSLVAHNPRWYAMINHVQTNQTFSAQLWMTKETKKMGWTCEAGTMTGYVEPIDTFSDMSHLIKMENWDADQTPLNITYLVSAFPEEPMIPLNDQQAFPARVNMVGYDATVEYLKKNIGVLYPNIVTDGNFDWNSLLDIKGQQGEYRMKGQYCLINTEHSERYTLSVKGSSVYRLRADESGYDNLFFAGDWTDNGVNLGCVEACIVSGMRAAAAMSGKDIKVIGDNGIFKMV